jgi:3-hydroxyanthranilate 3,4-dioxygenase
MSQSDLHVINTEKWIQANQQSFLPPVCNKLMHNQQLVVMFVGGPNNREDYHIEEGEELFYQIKGDMCVKILENGQHKDIHVKEGEFFILPGRVPHSPQRTANSVGLVIERRRLPHEIDGVRWFVPNSTQTLYEKWFHCKDLGTELIPLIKTFFASEEYKTKMPGKNVMDKDALPFQLNNTIINQNKHGAYNLAEKLSENKNQNLICLTPRELNLQFSVDVLKKGEYEFELNDNLDTWLWSSDGESLIELNGEQNVQSFTLGKFDSLLVPENTFRKISIKLARENSSLMKIVQNPNLIDKQ